MSSFDGDRQCDNCRRSGEGVVLTYYANCDVRRKHSKTYFAVASTSSLVGLCGHCGRYLMEKKKRNLAAEYWPAMIYVFLSHENPPEAMPVPFEMKWRLLPTRWKNWWSSEFSDRMTDNECSIFTDMTEEASNLEAAIENLEWMELAVCMDKHFAYPEVRCPFGCSEFLHRANKLPLEDFLWRFSNYEMPSYCSPAGRNWTDSISPSYPSSCLILEKFSCSPAVIVTDEGAMILGCREHSARTTEALLHVPESPTGTVFTPCANAFAPVTIRSRTYRNFKSNMSSDTFCTVKQVGGYAGIDTSYITASTYAGKCDALSSVRDALGIRGRADIKAQLLDRSCDKRSSTYMPPALIGTVVRFAERTFPCPENLPEARTATYISCEQAVELQEKTNGEGSKTIMFHKNGRSRECLFEPPWPTHMVCVHPADGYGQRFYRIVDKDVGMWLMLSMTSQVPELWERIAASVKDNLSWHGHWLRYATSVLRLKKGKQSSRIFDKKKRAEISAMFVPSLNQVLNDEELATELFSECSGVRVVGSNRDENGCFEGQDVLIFLQPCKKLLDAIPLLSEYFELRCLLMADETTASSSWRAFVRHAGQGLWVQSRGNKHFSKSSCTAVDDEDWMTAKIAVFCKKKVVDASKLRRRYLGAIGGQTAAFCDTHACPLILNHRRKNDISQNDNGCDWPNDVLESRGKVCGACVSYVCPTYKCRNGICDHHLAQAKEMCAKETPETVLLLSPGGFRCTEYLPDDDGAIRGSCTYDDIGPEALGPTMAHDIPHDLYNDYSSIDEDKDSYVSSFDETEDDWINEERRADDEIVDDTANNAGYHDWDTRGVEEKPEVDQDEDCDIMFGAYGETKPEISTQYGDGSLASVPLFVVLNQQGHLLARNNGKLGMNKASRVFFEKIVARSKSNIVPLVYAEAQLFPSIFWQGLECGSIAGAMPTALWTDAASLKQLGIASLRAHAKNRINNPALLSSVDPAYQFLLMDELVNLGLRGRDTRLVLHRGFADEQGSDGVRFRAGSDSAELYGEASENHANVHKLSALVRDRKPHFFFTQSCNQSTCCGLRVLRDWVTSEEAVDLLCTKYGLDRYQARCYLRESAASYILRSWNEVADMWMNYIINSSAQPLGSIEYAWYRKEFQEKQGNPSHIHAILRTSYDVDSSEGLNMVLSKIRGCVADLISRKEYCELRQRGIVSSADHLIEIMEQAKTYLTHRCHDRCKIPRRNGNGEETFVCKVKDNYDRTFEPFQHTIESVKVHHALEAKLIYNRLGMMKGDHVIEPCLRSEMHSPICSRMDPKFSPTNGELFSCYPSAQNLQFCSGKALIAYLVKYVAGLDDVAIAAIFPTRPVQPDCARAIVEPLNNTKITSNKLRVEERKKKKPACGRLLTQMEALTVILGDPLVTSTETFIHIPTSPREYRAGFVKEDAAWKDDVPDEVTERVVPNQDIRQAKRFPEHRLFSSDQMTVIQDEMESGLTVDKVTIFSLRPPELRFVNSMRLYFRWFEMKSVFLNLKWKQILQEYEERLDLDLGSCEWIDGLGRKITLRRGAIDGIVRYAMHDCPNILFGAKHAKPKNAMCSLLKQVQKLCRQFESCEVRGRRQKTCQASRWQYEKMCRLFLSRDKSVKLPTPWITAVYPKNRGRFLIHVLLYFGRFETEYGLMAQGNMRDAYIYAGLFDDSNPQVSLDSLMARYVRECLAFQSGSVFQHDRSLALADAAFRELLLEDVDSQEQIVQTPCVLQTAMMDDTDNKIETAIKSYLQSFVRALFIDLLNSGFPSGALPDQSTLMNLQPCESYTFPPEFRHDGRQCHRSYDEQCAVLERAKNTIWRYKSGKRHKNLVICGGPGNGKTTVCEEICMYAFSQGLTGIATSIVADRSKALGGMHIHLLCSLQARDGNNVSPGGMAEAAIASLYRKPELYSFWKRLDFLYIDELGAVSAQVLAIIDIIVRHIKRSNAFMGGMVVIATMDIHQLLPFNGTPLLLSMNAMIEFSFLELKHSVRAANDENLRRICDLSRTMNWNAESRSEFRKLIKENCNFVNSFEDERIPEDGIFVFGRKAPCKKIEELIIKRLSERPGLKKTVCRAIDEESSKTGNWKLASDPASQELSKKLKRQRELHLFEKGRYEFTYNLNGHFQQGQLAILLDFNEEDVRNRKKLEFFKGPPGCKEFPPVYQYSQEYLESHGWTRVLVPFETSKPTKIWSGLLGRRTQYGVRLRVASTIHASMGSTFGTLVTAVSNIGRYSELDFNLWDAAQVVVLISRTRRCSDIYFVGDPDEVIDQLLSVLGTTSKYMPHIRSLQAKLCDRSDVAPVLVPPPIFRPCDFVLHKSPAVYLLVSTRFPGYMYIGETMDIRKRLNDHNSGRGTGFTNNSRLRPWAVFGYLFGVGNRAQRRRMEQWWKRNVLKHRNRSKSLDASGVIEIARGLIAIKNKNRTEDSKIHIQICGLMERSAASSVLLDHT